MEHISKSLTAWGALKSTCRIDALGPPKSTAVLPKSIPGLPKSRPGRHKMRENSKKLAKGASRAILGGLWWPQWSILVAIWELWGATAGHFGSYFAVHGSSWTSRFLCFHWSCFLIIILVVFLWSAGWFTGRFFMLVYCRPSPYSAYDFVTVWLCFTSCLCIAEPLAICVLHSKNNGFHTFSIF